MCPRPPGVIVVGATFDPEAEVWVAQSSELPGLVTEADSLEALQEKIPAMIRDLLEDDGDDATCVAVPVELLATSSQRESVFTGAGANQTGSRRPDMQAVASVVSRRPGRNIFHCSEAQS